VTTFTNRIQRISRPKIIGKKPKSGVVTYYDFKPKAFHRICISYRDILGVHHMKKKYGISIPIPENENTNTPSNRNKRRRANPSVPVTTYIDLSDEEEETNNESRLPNITITPATASSESTQINRTLSCSANSLNSSIKNTKKRR
jgi:hypothetical protein